MVKFSLKQALFLSSKSKATAFVPDTSAPSIFISPRRYQFVVTLGDDDIAVIRLYCAWHRDGKYRLPEQPSTIVQKQSIDEVLEYLKTWEIDLHDEWQPVEGSIEDE